MEPKRLGYVAVRRFIRDGDVLLWRGTSWLSKLIRWAGRSPYSHAGLAVWIRGRLMVAESREGSGIRLLPLRSAVAGAEVDLYEVGHGTDLAVDTVRDQVVERALELLGQAYGYRRILRLAVGRIPLVGRLVKSWSFDDELRIDGRLGIVCSAYVALCWHMAGLDLVPNLSDGSTEPGDLARSALLKLRGRLELE